MSKVTKFILLAIALIGVYEEYLSIRVLCKLRLVTYEFAMILLIAIGILCVIGVLVYNIIKLEWEED